MISTVYEVEGMNCRNCANAVTSAISGLPEIAEARVDLTAGTVAVTSNRTPDTRTLVEAVAAAGYTLRA